MEQVNWVAAHEATDLDELISPLCSAAFLGRSRVVELLLENPNLDLNLVTQEMEYSPLCCGSMAGQFEAV
jgi:hypothetical protein